MGALNLSGAARARRDEGCRTTASQVRSIAVDGHAVTVDLDGDATLAFLIVEIARADCDDGERPDHEVKEALVHYSAPRDFLEAMDIMTPQACSRGAGPFAPFWGGVTRGSLRITDRVLDAANGVLNLALNLVCFAFRRKLGIGDRLADRDLGLAFDNLRGTDHPILVHNVFPSVEICPPNGWRIHAINRFSDPFTLTWVGPVKKKPGILVWLDQSGDPADRYASIEPFRFQRWDERKSFAIALHDHIFRPHVEILGQGEGHGFRAAI